MNTTEQEKIISETNVLLQRIREGKAAPGEDDAFWKKLKDRVSDIKKLTEAGYAEFCNLNRAIRIAKYAEFRNLSEPF